jgi:8-oxo-dGTP pyrophosphatase MutT (NUDIX family)
MSALDDPGRELRLRRAGRVIVLDPEDRVLLFRYDDGLPNGRHWCTPGGGLDDGEDYQAGARRELAEETGWTDVPVRSEVYEQTRTIEHADAIVRQHERFFLARVEVTRRRLGEVADIHASDGIAAWRWWTLAELDATDEVVWPARLADLIRGLLGRPGLAGLAGQALDAVDEAGQQAVRFAGRDVGDDLAGPDPALRAPWTPDRRGGVPGVRPVR